MTNETLLTETTKRAHNCECTTPALTMALGQNGLRLAGLMTGTVPNTEPPEEKVLTHEALIQRAKELAAQIGSNFAGKEVTFLTVMEGGAPWQHYMTIAMREHNESAPDDQKVTLTFENCQIQSYGAGTKSSGVIQFTNEPKSLSKKEATEALKPKNIIIIDDIVDTGLTTDWLISYLSRACVEGSQIKVCAMLNKPERRKRSLNDMKIDYLGFEIENVYVVGEGMDCDGYGREIAGVHSTEENVSPVAQ